MPVRSDDGSNFRAGEQELRTAKENWDQRAICEFLRLKNICWKFNPPYASHVGGVWEQGPRSRFSSGGGGGAKEECMKEIFLGGGDMLVDFYSISLNSRRMLL